jgi:hypothetical protein
MVAKGIGCCWLAVTCLLLALGLFGGTVALLSALEATVVLAAMATAVAFCVGRS